MKNFPVQTVDPETGKEITIWNSRAMAAAIFVFTQDKAGNWYVLANKRGPGCPDFVGHWTCPCGYLDYNETLAHAAFRECHEETGILLIDPIHFYTFNDNPKENRQNVTARFYCIVKDTINCVLTSKNSEKDEVDEIEWKPLNKIDECVWAFNHNEIIKEIFEKRINLPWYKKVIMYLANKYVK